MLSRSHYFLGILITCLVLYWSYLAFMTQPIAVHDAKSFESFGRMIHEKGWKEYFVSGPHREPFYPALIAWSMRIAGEGPYGDVLKSFQFILLLISFLLFCELLKRGKISLAIAALAAGYFGFSPAMTNSVFSLFSEGVTYSAVLAIIFVASKAWRSLQNDHVFKALVLGGCFGFCMVMITMIKGIYEMIFPLMMVPFVVLGIQAWRRKERYIVLKTFLFLATTLVVFMSCLCGYKSLNKKYNGLYVLTDRASWAFYGAAARREMPLDARSFGAAAAYALFEEDGCKVLFSGPDCEVWHVRTAEYLGAHKNYEVTAKFPLQEQNAQMFKAALEKIGMKPFQYVLLTGLEWVHMFYWETTQIGFVVYPDWLEKIYANAFFAKALRFIIGTFSLVATVYSALYLWRNRPTLWVSQKQNPYLMPILFFSTYIILCHVSAYSLFAIVPRHAVPIAPALILVFACLAQVIFYKKAS